jgi:hypothetical protein
MGGRLHRERLRANARDLQRRFAPKKSYCPNCKELLVNGGHFVPPSFGDPGIFICQKKEKANDVSTP